MVGSAGIVASTLNNRHQRRESRASEEVGGPGGRTGSKATISEVTRPSNREPQHITLRKANKIPPTTLTEQEVSTEKMSLKEQMKFYVSLTLGILASICVFALLFLIPLVVEPSISTLLADFDPKPATCVTVGYKYATGISKCGRYSSCREGCTSTPSQCHQINVSYRRHENAKAKRTKNFTMLEAREWLNKSTWDASDTQLQINAKGCGYPPRVQCEEFGDTYGQVGRTFPCYYSRANPLLVVTDYNWQEAAYPLLLSLGLPTGLFAVSISVLSFWYCPSCEERGKNKRPCRSRYFNPKLREDMLDRRLTSESRIPNPPPPISQPILQQPRNKNYHPRSPSLATISSKDTTVSSVSSMDEGWQSPPSPPPRMGNTRINASSKSNLTRARKL